jgi:hypothetical protein
VGLGVVVLRFDKDGGEVKCVGLGVVVLRFDKADEIDDMGGSL